jgi:hypothetical protein
MLVINKKNEVLYYQVRLWISWYAGQAW